MTILIAGVVLWAAVHLVPALAPGFRQTLTESLGEKPYKAVFAAVILGSLVLIVIGWRHTMPQGIYPPPAWGRPAAIALMIVAVYLFGAARRPAAVKRVIRHPQLTGMTVWAVAHLLANGDQRSLLLFGGLGTWAIIEMLAINRRDGVSVPPESPTLAREIVGIVVTLAFFAVLVWGHRWFAGVALV